VVQAVIRVEDSMGGHTSEALLFDAVRGATSELGKRAEGKEGKLMPEDSYFIVCSRGRKSSKPCKCGRRSTKLCDFEIKVGDTGHTRTCDEPLCDRCATRVGQNRDYCIPHANFASKKA
jgi:hypothetical protein